MGEETIIGYVIIAYIAGTALGFLFRGFGQALEDGGMEWHFIWPLSVFIVFAGLLMLIEKAWSAGISLFKRRSGRSALNQSQEGGE